MYFIVTTLSCFWILSLLQGASFEDGKKSISCQDNMCDSLNTKKIGANLTVLQQANMHLEMTKSLVQTIATDQEVLLCYTQKIENLIAITKNFISSTEKNCLECVDCCVIHPG